MSQSGADSFHDRWAIVMTRDDEVWLTVQLKDGVGAEVRFHEWDIKLVEKAFKHAGVSAKLTTRPRQPGSSAVDYFARFGEDTTLQQLRKYMVYMNDHAA